MKEGKFEAAISSPPYAGSAIEKNSAGVDIAKQYATYRSQGGGASFESFQRTQALHSQGYGKTDGQLGALPEGMPMQGFDAAVSSPPFEGNTAGCESAAERLQTRPDGSSFGAGRSTARYGKQRKGAEYLDMSKRKRNALGHFERVADSEAYDQMGNMEGDTFWSAAKIIVAETHKVLKPGGVAIFVCKDFVRKGKRVPFSDQWQALCESAGFTLLCRHKAMLVKELGHQHTLDGEVDRLTVERKSFFRKIAEKKGSPAIDWEDVICMRAAQ